MLDYEKEINLLVKTQCLKNSQISLIANPKVSLSYKTIGVTGAEAYRFYTDPLYSINVRYNYYWTLFFLTMARDNCLILDDIAYSCREAVQTNYKDKIINNKLYFIVCGGESYFNKLTAMISYIEEKLNIKNRTKITRMFSNAILFDVSDFWFKYGLRFSLFTAIIKSLRRIAEGDLTMLAEKMLRHYYFKGDVKNESFKLFLRGYNTPHNNKRHYQWVESHFRINKENIKDKLWKKK